MARGKHEDVDAYISAAPRAAQPMLRELRALIRAAAPKAEERMSYGMPFYDYGGRLVYFAGYEHHVALYVVGGAKKTLAKELQAYLAGKSTLRFPIGRPLPVPLIHRLIKARIKELEAAPRAE